MAFNSDWREELAWSDLAARRTARLEDCYRAGVADGLSESSDGIPVSESDRQQIIDAITAEFMDGFYSQVRAARAILDRTAASHDELEKLSLLSSPDIEIIKMNLFFENRQKLVNDICELKPEQIIEVRKLVDTLIKLPSL